MDKAGVWENGQPGAACCSVLSAHCSGLGTTDAASDQPQPGLWHVDRLCGRHLCGSGWAVERPVAAPGILVALHVVVAYKTQTQAALVDLRRIVHNLRPPALDQFGLLSAFRQYLATAQDANLQIELDAPEQLPALPAAVKVAAYHILLEALANVIRHAQAQRCIITLQIADAQLTLTICDDGKGLSPDHVAGVGLRSMRERAEEVGGGFTVRASTSGGTQITDHLPLIVSAFPQLFVSTKEDVV